MSDQPEVERGLAEFMRIAKKNGVDTKAQAELIRAAFLAGGEWFGVMTVKAALAMEARRTSQPN